MKDHEKYHRSKPHQYIENHWTLYPPKGKYMNKIVQNRVKYSDDAIISHRTNPSEKSNVTGAR